ncbi:hypothetical protein ACXYTP_23300 [Tsukamurella ocularis]
MTPDENAAEAEMVRARFLTLVDGLPITRSFVERVPLAVAADGSDRQKVHADLVGEVMMALVALEQEVLSLRDRQPPTL